MSAARDLINRLVHPRAASAATALDIALTDYERRHGDVRFEVIVAKIDDRGIEFTVRARI